MITKYMKGVYKKYRQANGGHKVIFEDDVVNSKRQWLLEEKKDLIEDVQKEIFRLEVRVRKQYYYFNIYSILRMDPNQVQGYEFVLMQEPYAQTFNTGLEDALASRGKYEVTFVKYKGNYKYHIGGLRFLG